MYLTLLGFSINVWDATLFGVVPNGLIQFVTFTLKITRVCASIEQILKGEQTVSLVTDR